MERADVVVVGAGLAGLQCARLVARRGWRVVIVERKRHPADFVHTTGIFVRRTFEEFGFPPQTLGPPIRRVRIEAPSGRAAVLESSRDEFRIGRMRELYAATLDDAIAAGARFRGGCSFDGLDYAADSVRVRIRGGTAVETIATRLVVAADGASSRVAPALGLATPQAFLTGVEEVHRLPRPGAVPQLRCFLDPAIAPGYIAWIADDGEEVHAGAAGIERRFNATAALAFLRERLRDHLGQSLPAPAEKRGGRIPVCGILPRIATRRGLLVGDAAGAVSALTGGGLDAAVRLSAYAAQAIDATLGLGADLPQIYSGDRFRARFVSRLWARRAYSLLAHRWSTELLVGLLGLPSLRPFGEAVFFGHGSFPIAAEEIAMPFRAALEG